MKNTATPAHGSDEGRPGPAIDSAREAWSAALVRFDRDLQRRGAADRTRRAYGADVGELATWAAAQGLEPSAIAWGTRVTTITSGGWIRTTFPPCPPTPARDA